MKEALIKMAATEPTAMNNSRANQPINRPLHFRERSMSEGFDIYELFTSAEEEYDTSSNKFRLILNGHLKFVGIVSFKIKTAVITKDFVNNVTDNIPLPFQNNNSQQLMDIASYRVITNKAANTFSAYVECDTEFGSIVDICISELRVSDYEFNKYRKYYRDS